MPKFIFLSDEFRKDYPHQKYSELEQKENRPYILIYITIDNYNFAIQLRSNISHNYAYITDKENKCGIDFSKAVYLSKNEYIDKSRTPSIRDDEFKVIKGKEFFIKQQFIKYIDNYLKAKNSTDLRKRKMLKFSTLKYFENDVNYERIVLNNLKENALV